MKLIVSIVFLAFLAACTGPQTSQIGADVTGEQLLNPAGQNSLSVTLDAETGIPTSIFLSQGKDETDVLWETIWQRPDGTKITGRYKAANSNGSVAAIALLDAVMLTVKEEQDTARQLGPAAMQALLEGLRLTLTGGV